MTYSRRSEWSRYALLALRIGMGLMFVYAAWTKLREPWAVFAISVDAYGILPQWAVVAVARGLPWAELALGLLLLSGVFLRAAATASSVILLFFFAILVHSYAKGLQIDCGCFGFGEAISPRTLARDGGLLLASLAMTVLAFRRAAARRASQAMHA